MKLQVMIHFVFAILVGVCLLFASSVAWGQAGIAVEVVWNPDETQVALLYSANATIEIWEKNPIQLIQTLELHEAEVNAVRWSPDGSMLASVDSGGKAILWDASTWNSTTIITETTTFEGGKALLSIAWDPSGTHVAIGNASGTVTIYEANSGTLIGGMVAHEGNVTAVEWTADNNYILTAGRDSSVALWDANDYDLLHVMTEVNKVWINDLALNPLEFQVATANSDGTVSIWDLISGTQLAHFQAQPYKLNGVSAIDWSQDGRFLVTVGGDNYIRFWNALSVNYYIINSIEVEYPLYTVDFGPISNEIVIVENELSLPETGLNITPLAEVGTD